MAHLMIPMDGARLNEPPAVWLLTVFPVDLQLK